jgi:hypothetical protein
MKETKIIEDIKKIIAYLESIITSGSCTDFEDYRYNSGKLAAFRECIKIIKDHKDE